MNRLRFILSEEQLHTSYDTEAVEYIAKIADGGMRDAISLMDKCLSFSVELTLENVVKSLGTVDYEVMKAMTDAILDCKEKKAIQYIEDIHSQGKDIKQFVNQYVRFLLDVEKYAIGCDFKYMQLPALAENKKWLEGIPDDGLDHIFYKLLKPMIKLNSDIKWSQTPKYDLEIVVLLACRGE